MIADQWGVSREDLDAFSAESQQRAARATAEGRFDNEIVPVYVRDDEGNATDELMRDRRGHPPRHHGRDARQSKARVQGGRQGHRRQLIADHRRRLGGADHERGEGQGARLHAARTVPLLRPRRRRPGDDAHRPDPGDHARCSSGPASRMDDIDLIEINEAFASVVLAWQKEHRR